MSMKNIKLLMLLLLALPAEVQAQFTFTTNNGAITITGYTGSSKTVTIPSTTNTFPVTSIGNGAFQNQTSVTNVIIPNSVSSIGTNAFYDCSSLKSVTIGNNVTNIEYRAFAACSQTIAVYFQGNAPSADSTAFVGDYLYGVVYYLPGTTGWGLTFCGLPAYMLSPPFLCTPGITISGYTGSGGAVTIPATINGLPVISIGPDVFINLISLTSVIIPNSVTSIGTNAFEYCENLTSVTIPNNVTNICRSAFASCLFLHYVYFTGNAPSPTNDLTVFSGDNEATVYYLPNTTGWGSTFDGLPTVLWSPIPAILNNDPSVGVQTNGFGFNILWTTNNSVVVEATTNLANPIWSPVQTNTLTGGTNYFSDPWWTNYPSRFYRLRSP
jgi:hypothetical protein